MAIRLTGNPLHRLALAAAILASCAIIAQAQEHGGGHTDDGASGGHEESDHVHPGEDHEGGVGRGLGPRWQGGGSSEERGGHEDGGHDTGEDHADGGESGEDHAEGKRGPRYMGGRATDTILTSRHGSSLEDRVFRGHGN